ncbi:MAG: anaerobic glycerol-3-phosphate dehydrogenase subunit A [Syntrophaceae bacterium]|nr:anaerobic glycerol-3-phosphate dehydrogenase subunit A [Syntrophaceae bacterium]
MDIKTEVLIIGGGATGTGIARDLSLRAIPCVLVEKGDLASGASGRNHGLLHSGARYAVSDPEAARECISENRILRRIAGHCIEETGGLFISLSEDSPQFRERFLMACEEAGIPTALYSRDQALELEPELNPDLLSAVKVPDGAINPFELVRANAKDAERHGAKLLFHTGITSLLIDQNQVRGGLALDLLSGEDYKIEASFVVNATGAWVNQVLKLAGLRIDMALSKGSMLITNQRLNQRVINRCRPASDGDIVVPNETVSILGTTSVRSEEVEDFEVTPPEVSLLLTEASRMIPAIRGARLIRAYAGIRPLFQSGGTGGDRQISRSFALIDHGERDGLKNLMTITGGKLITYRLMAERTSDLICRKMGVDVSCSTHLKPLPVVAESLRPKDRLQKIAPGGEVLCDCELVRREELEEILETMQFRDIRDILHRTRLAKGTCQGGFCVYRLLGLLHESGLVKESPNKVLKAFLEERWKGIRPILWGGALKEEELIESIYKGIFNLKDSVEFGVGSSE